MSIATTGTVETARDRLDNNLRTINSYIRNLRKYLKDTEYPDLEYLEQYATDSREMQDLLQEVRHDLLKIG